MDRLLKSRDYLKKCLGFILLFGFISLGAIGGCNNHGGGDLEDQDGLITTILNIFNGGGDTTVFAVFAADSCTVISDWSNGAIKCLNAGDTTCTTTSNPSICSFPIDAGDTCTLPLFVGCPNNPPISVPSSSINFGFNPEVVTMPCGTSPGTGPSLAEVNINGAASCSKTPGCDSPPCDCVDISLVQGYKLPNISMILSDGPTTLGPTAGMTGNQKVFGIFPVGCTNCVTCVGPPCGINCDNSQCHQGGTPNDPDLPCQASQPTGGTITINILAN